MKKENDTVSTAMDFSSASAIIGGLDSFLEEGVSFNIPDKNDEGGEPEETSIDISSFGDFSKSDDEDENGEEGEKEEDVEGKQKPVEEKPKIEEKDKEVKQLDYKSVINSLIENKIFEGFDTIENGEGEEIPFSDFEVDSDAFVEIITSKIEELKEQANSNTTKDLSDFTKHLLQIEKNGGNVSQALETYKTYQDPLDSFDLSNELDQQKAIFMKYHNVMGMEKEVVMDLIDGFISKGKLEDEAIKADTEIRGAVAKQLEAINKQAVADKVKKKESLKVYRDSLRDNLNKFELNDHYKRKILDVATKEDENGVFALDSLYYSTRNNPEKAASLLLFLTDPEEYKKQISKEEVRSSQLDTFKKLKLVKKGSDNIKIDNKGKENINSDKNLIEINDIFGS